MFALALYIGIYAYLIFFLGVMKILYSPVIFGVSVVYLVGISYWHRRELISFFSVLHKKKLVIKKERATLFVVLLLLLAIVNSIGAFGPEYAFDALWYHLTLPKLYLLAHAIHYIPGSLLYYSVMPQLIEMLYIPALAFGNEITAKIIHFLFGLLTLVALYLFSRTQFDRKISLLICLVFYSNLVVAWESTTAYIDLGRAFYECLGLWAFMIWVQTQKEKWFRLSAVLIGFAIATKLLAFGSLGIFLLLIYLALRKKEKIRHIVKKVVTYAVICISIPLPWFIYTYMYTGNPVYPFFTKTYQVGFDWALLLPWNFMLAIWRVLVTADDPISPMYIIVIPLVGIFYRKFSTTMKTIMLYSVFALCIWYVTPRTGGGRFLLPYLPAFSLVVGAVIHEMKKEKVLVRFLIVISIIIASTTVVYRAMAVTKNISVITGNRTKSSFLAKQLNFSYGDFYDIDGSFKKIVGDKTVLLYGFHNLYYMNVQFIDNSWVKKGDTFTYVAVQNGELPARFANWKLIYQNNTTKIKLYALGEDTWVY